MTDNDQTKRPGRWAGARRTAFKLAVFTLPSLILLFVLLEVVFRTALPARELPFVTFDEQYRILRYDTHGPREGRFTDGPRLEARSRWRINDRGWNALEEYLPADARTRPLVAVIGDSYVEAMNVDVGDDLSSVLRRLCQADRDVYGFGMSGAPLTQYLQMSRYVTAAFDPDTIVFVVVYNDFVGSVRDFKKTPYYLQLDLEEDGRLTEVAPRSYRPSRLRRSVGRSAVVRYFWFHSNLRSLLGRQKAGSSDRLDDSIGDERMGQERPVLTRMTHTVLRTIREENPRRRLLFVLDGPRREIYAGQGESTRYGWVHEVMRDATAEIGAELVDLTATFAEHYRQHGTRLDTDFNYHWTDVGHRLAAEAVHDVLVNPPPARGPETTDPESARAAPSPVRENGP